MDPKTLLSSACLESGLSGSDAAAVLRHLSLDSSDSSVSSPTRESLIVMIFTRRNRILDQTARILDRRKFDEILFRLCSRVVFAPPIQASFLAIPDVLSTGCSMLDSCLGGGLIASGISEICGQASAGKTQLCLQLSLEVQKSRKHGGLEGRALYICSEGDFPSRRLEELVKLRGGNSMKSSHVLVENANTAEELDSILRVRLPARAAVDCVRLVVIDSVANIFRYEGGGDGERASMMFSFAQLLKKLADEYQLVIVVINQVISLIDDNVDEKKVAALGLSWSNCINTRIQLARTSTAERREMRIVFSATLPPRRIYFRVTSYGVQGLDS